MFTDRGESSRVADWFLWIACLDYRLASDNESGCLQTSVSRFSYSTDHEGMVAAGAGVTAG